MPELILSVDEDLLMALDRQARRICRLPPHPEDRPRIFAPRDARLRLSQHGCDDERCATTWLTVAGEVPGRPALFERLVLGMLSKRGAKESCTLRVKDKASASDGVSTNAWEPTTVRDLGGASSAWIDMSEGLRDLLTEVSPFRWRSETDFTRFWCGQQRSAVPTFLLWLAYSKLVAGVDLFSNEGDSTHDRIAIHAIANRLGYNPSHLSAHMLSLGEARVIEDADQDIFEFVHEATNNQVELPRKLAYAFWAFQLASLPWPLADPDDERLVNDEASEPANVWSCKIERSGSHDD